MSFIVGKYSFPKFGLKISTIYCQTYTRDTVYTVSCIHSRSPALSISFYCIKIMSGKLPTAALLLVHRRSRNVTEYCLSFSFYIPQHQQPNEEEKRKNYNTHSQIHSYKMQFIMSENILYSGKEQRVRCKDKQKRGEQNEKRVRNVNVKIGLTLTHTQHKRK